MAVDSLKKLTAGETKIRDKTMHEFKVTDEQIAAFHKDGFIVVNELFDALEMAGLLCYAKNDNALVNESYVRRDGSGAETRLALRNELDDDSVYSAIVRSQRVARTMERLLGDEIYHYHHKMTLKQPKIGGAWEWHQDYGYWYNYGCLYPDMGSCLIAVDRATTKNGCLQVIRGSHNIGRVDHFKTGDQVGADPVRIEAALAQHELVYCEMSPGDAIFFHGNLMHRSDRNDSDQSRWSLICCYNTRHNDPFLQNGRHPNYSALEIWPDERVMKSIIDHE